MHYLNESAFKAYKNGGCEEVEIYAAKDKRTCEIYGTKHKKKYKIDKRPILPFHPNCRCTYLPVINTNNIENSYKKNFSNSNKSDIIKNIENIKFKTLKLVGAMAKRIYVKKDKIELKQSISSD